MHVDILDCVSLEGSEQQIGCNRVWLEGLDAARCTNESSHKG